MRILSLLCFLAAPFAFAQDFDLLIRGGRIVDGTGNPSFHRRYRDPRQPDCGHGPSGGRHGQAQHRRGGSHGCARLHRHAQPFRLHAAGRWQCAEHDPPGRDVDDSGGGRIGGTRRRQAAPSLAARAGERRRAGLDGFQRLLRAPAAAGHLDQRRRAMSGRARSGHTCMASRPDRPPRPNSTRCARWFARRWSKARSA